MDSYKLSNAREGFSNFAYILRKIKKPLFYSYYKVGNGMLKRLLMCDSGEKWELQELYCKFKNNFKNFKKEVDI